MIMKKTMIAIMVVDIMKILGEDYDERYDRDEGRRDDYDD